MLIRFTTFAALSLLTISAFAQTPANVTHEVGTGDTLYGIVAQYYPEKMVRWTDVAVDLVALNPGAFPQGLDTVMKLGDQLILVDYGKPLATTQGVASSVDVDVNTNEASPIVGTQPSYSLPGATLDSVTPDAQVETVNLSNQKDIAPTALDNSTAATAENRVNSAPSDEVDLVDPSATAIGKVVSVSQTAFAIDHNNQQRTLVEGDGVFLGDAITTQRNSMVAIRMIDEAALQLGPSSRVMFERYQYDAKSKRGSAVMTLVKGGFGVVSGLLGANQPDAITVNTAVATIGVRGTEFALRVCAPQTCRTGNDNRALEPGLYTGVIEGTIVISNNTGDLPSNRGEFYHVAAPNTVPEAATHAAALLFDVKQLAALDVEVEEEKPLSFLGWLKRKVLGD